jgi:hypothetical protein
MSETTYNLIQAMANGDALETEQAFGNAMAEKLAVKLDDMRTGIAQNMFNSQPVAEESIDEAKASDEGKTFANAVKAAHPNTKVVSDGKTHYIMHKDDEDGSEHGGIKIEHKNGMIHASHTSNTSEDEPKGKSGSHDEMHKHISSLVKQHFPE